MKKILTTTLLVALACAAFSQEASNVSLRLDKATGELSLSFDFQAPDASGNDRLTITPLLSGTRAEIAFPALVVEGRRARISRLREERSTGATPPRGALHVNGGTLSHYRAALPAGEWEGQGEVTLTTRVFSERCGCEVASARAASLPAIALTLPGLEVVEEVPPVVAPAEVAPVAVAPPTPTVAPALERLSARYRFVAPATALAREVFTGPAKGAAVDRYIQENEAGAVVVYFTVNNSNVDLSLRDNAAVLARLEEAIRALAAIPGTRPRAVVVGFASPEGNALSNDILAMRRGQAVDAYVNARLARATALREPVAIETRVLGGGADWRGLRELVASSPSMPGRDAVLRVIDTKPAYDPKTRVSRMELIKRINGGDSYRYMARYFFPALRNAAYIKVFYEVAE